LSNAVFTEQVYRDLPMLAVEWLPEAVIPQHGYMTTSRYGDLDTRIDAILPDLVGWCTPEKGKRIARLVRDANTRLCVELGVFGGRSLVALALGVAQNGFGHVHGIDPFTKSAAVEGTNAKHDDAWWAEIDYEDVRRQAIHVVETNGLAPYVTFVREKSMDVVDRYENGSIDVLHQDSNHSAEVSTAEVLAWMPKLRLGAFWIFDDIDWPTTRPAQQLLLQNGFHCVETYAQWALFQSVGGTLKGC
jgi:predicted O-methyltransferase YrrM